VAKEGISRVPEGRDAISKLKEEFISKVGCGAGSESDQHSADAGSAGSDGIAGSSRPLASRESLALDPVEIKGSDSENEIQDDAEANPDNISGKGAVGRRASYQFFFLWAQMLYDHLLAAPLSFHSPRVCPFLTPGPSFSSQASSSSSSTRSRPDVLAPFCDLAQAALRELRQILDEDGTQGCTIVEEMRLEAPESVVALHRSAMECLECRFNARYMAGLESLAKAVRETEYQKEVGKQKKHIEGLVRERHGQACDGHCRRGEQEQTILSPNLVVGEQAVGTSGRRSGGVDWNNITIPILESERKITQFRRHLSSMYHTKQDGIFDELYEMCMHRPRLCIL